MAEGIAQPTNGSKEEGRARTSKLVFPFSLSSLSLKSFGVGSRNVTNYQSRVTLKILIQASAKKKKKEKKKKKKDVSRGSLLLGMSGGVSFRG